MATLLSVLKNILAILGAIPTILQLVREVKKAIDAMNAEQRRKDELKRQEEMAKVGDKLKDSIEAGNEQGVDDALNDIVNDYNRRS